MDMQKKSFFLTIIKRAFWVPFILLMIGIVLTAFAWVLRHYPSTFWPFYSEISADFGNFLIVLSIAFFIYRGLVIGCTEYEKWLSHRKRTMAPWVVSIIRRGLRIIFFLVAIQIVVSYLGLSDFYLSIVRKSIDVILIGSVGWIFLQILTATEAYFYQYSLSTTLPDIQRRKGLYTKIHLIKNALTLVIIILTLAAMLMVFEQVRNVGLSLLASAGFLTAILGLAAQRTLGSLFGGIHLALSQPIRIDDLVIMEGMTGTIEEITLSYVTLRLPNLNRMIFPISYFNDKPFQHLSRVPGPVMGNVILSIDYRIPISHLRDALDQILAHSPYWNRQTGLLQVTGMQGTSIEITLSLSAEDHTQLGSLRAEALERLVEFIRTHYPDLYQWKLNRDNAQ